MSEQLYYQNQLQALEDIKNTYFRQLDEIEKKRAEIAIGKEEIKNEESLLIDEYERIREAKKLISIEYEELVIKNDELKLAKKEYEKKREGLYKKEKDLLPRINRYHLDLESLEKRKCDNYRIMRSQYEEELSTRKREKRLLQTKQRLDKKIGEIIAQKADIVSQEMDIEVENEKIERKRKYVEHQDEILNARQKGLESRRSELQELEQKTENEVGKHVTIHRQNLEIKKLDARVEQQSDYIKGLEDELLEAALRLETVLSELKKMSVCSKILEYNIDLQQVRAKPVL
ncbi:hypothetical protein [Methanolobus halotolerans]|uniref:Uncharacterized protein n=1 Tax=Methanolobus halotolerans TaxID=2052935 RepID=A0A4E0PX25_9EURY|nr:hypothetical protein [Methanolobus halotolerans]TGC09138.1 hypothetical protein CUN85_07140 [Methanolobus halotolerans]